MNSKIYFAAAVKHLFKLRFQQQKILAMEAGVSVSTVSAIFNDDYSGMPGEKGQTKIAAVFGYELIDFLQFGKTLFEGKREGIVPKSQLDEVNSSQTPYEPFHGYSEVMSLKLRDRPRLIKHLAAVANGFGDWMGADGDQQFKEKPQDARDIQRLIDGEVLETDLYIEYDKFFRWQHKKVEAAIKRKEAGPIPDD